MSFSHEFYMDIKTIHIAHEYILDRAHGCEYPSERGHYGLVYVLSGKAEYRFFTGDRITVTDGDVLFLSPNCAYSIATEKQFKHYTVNFDIHEHTSRLIFLDNPYCLIQEENTETLKRKFIELTNTWISKKNGFEMLTIGCLYELLSLFYFVYSNRQNATSYHRLIPAKEHIDRHFHQPITLEQLAKLSNMSVTNFRRAWKKQYTESPMQYLSSVRLHYAKEYLNIGYYTVSEVAQKCGFDDVSYFVRFFKKQTGSTPGAYKNR